MKKKIIASFLCLAITLTGCTSSDEKNAATLMLNKLSTEYNTTFEIVDIDTRPTSEVNELGDVYYAYVKYTGERAELQNMGFYCEVNKNLTIFDDCFANIRFRPSLDSYYKDKIDIDDAIVVTSVATDDNDSYVKKYNYRTVFNNNIEHSITIVIPVSDVDAESLDAEVCYKELKESLTRLNSKYSGSLYIVYCKDDYVEEYVDYLNHLQKFNYKVKYKKIIADITYDLSSVSDVKASFIRQMNSDLNAKE